MLKKLLLVMMLCALMATMWAFEPHFMKDPDISPDGSQVCFVYNGDLWTVPFEGGQATRLTDTYYNEYEPKYSPDGKKIVFLGNGEGVSQIYSIDVQGGVPEKISTSGYGLYDWFPDGKSLLGGKYNPRLGLSFSEIPLNENRPKDITLKGDSFATVSNDGKRIVYCDRGDPFREAYRGSTNGELWEYNIKKDKYTKLTNSDVTERYPVFSKQHDNRLYYAKSDGEILQLFVTENYDFTNEQKLTSFKTWSVRDLSIARENDRLVFEKFDEIWAYDGQEAKKINIDINELIVPVTVERENVKNGFEDIEITSNDKVLVFTYMYDLFMMPKDGGPVKQITFDHVPISKIQTLEDDDTIVILRRDRGYGQLYKIKISEPQELIKIAWSEDRDINDFEKTGAGNFLIHYTVNNKEIKAALTDKTFSNFDRLTFADKRIYSYVERIDSDYVAITEIDFVKSIYYLSLYNSRSGQIFPIYNSYKGIYGLVWGKDDRTLFFTESGNVKRVDLHAVDKLAKYQDPWDKILKEEDKLSEEDSEETEVVDYPELNIDFTEIDKRIYTVFEKPGFCRVLSVINDTTMVIEKNDSGTVFYKTNYYGEHEEEITKIEEKTYYTYNDKSKNYYYNDENMIRFVNLESSATGKIENSFFYEYDKSKIRRQLFKEVWGRFGTEFYDPQMHGVDWNKLYDKYLPYVDYCKSNNDIASIVEEMIGEVNASHTGFYPKSDKYIYSYIKATIGASLDYSERLSKGIKFRTVYDNTSLKDVYNVQAGDLLLAVDGVKIDKETDIPMLFANKVFKNIKLEIKRQGEDKQEIWVKGITGYELYDLEYRDWVNKRSEIVKRNSDDRIAYLHIKGMNQTALKKFMEDFWNDNLNKEGFIIDVRGNGGGNISDELIDIIERDYRSVTSSRYYGDMKIKRDRKTFDKPIVVLIDEDSFSDAEVFPHLMKQEELATLIGMPTSGSVIGTYNIDLFEGSSMRIPSSGWWTLDGTNMEGNGAQPDIKVEMTPEDYINDNDVQLETAIDFLLNR